VRFAWPLTGRSEEMRTIDAAISASDAAGIVVCGAAGVGKSRVAREALSNCASRGYESRWAIGTSSARALPLGAFASWAPATGTDNLRVVRDVIDSLTSAPLETPVVVGVDDVHLIDDLSAFVLQQIVQRRAAKVVLTIRDGEPIPAGVREIWSDGQLDRLDLQPLSRDETMTLVSATLGGPLDPDARTRLWRLTRGNVLYLRNIVEQEVGDGRLTRLHGFWRWTGEPVVSSTLAELIESRIGALPSEVGDVIDTLAVGEPIDLAALRRITDSAAVEAADMRGLITLDRMDGNVEVRVAHPLYGEVRRRRTATTRLRRLRGLVAAELAASDDRDDMRIVVRRAALSLDSDLTPDPHLLVRAAQGAVWLADLPLANRLADAAMRAGGGSEANFIRAHALSWLSRGEEADAVLAAIPTDSFTDADHARLAFLRASNLLWTLGNPDGAKKLIDSATTPHNCVDAFLAVYWAAAGKPEESARASKAIDLESLPGIVSAVTAWAIAVAAGDAGRATDAVTAAETGYAVAASAFDAAHMRFVIADAHIGSLMLAGRIAEAGDAAERLQKQSVDLPGAAQLFSSAVAARAALGPGDLGSVSTVLGQVVELLSAIGETNGFGYRYQLSRTVGLAMRGLTKEASAALAALEERRHPSWRYIDYERALAHAWVAASQGALTEAITTVLSAAETAQGNGQFAAEVLCLQAATQFGSRTTAARLRELEGVVEGPRVGVAARFAAALKTGDSAELEAVSQAFERMGDVVAAVDAAAHAAAAYRHHDLRGSAFGCASRAGELAERCGARTPALDLASERLPLTDREREIVRLIGEGLSSRAVADRLSLSVRTVEGHIYRSMAKTGTSSREELAALLPRHKRA
jgi:DNA-binding CsgD family transcriptional regulator